MSVTWHIVNNRFTNEYLSYPITGTLIQDPYPAFWWYKDNDALKNRYLSEPVYSGAFCDCTGLKTVVIPASVKYIGDYAFYNTALTSVTIASDCVFSDISFPPRCIINYYVE